MLRLGAMVVLLSFFLAGCGGGGSNVPTARGDASASTASDPTTSAAPDSGLTDDDVTRFVTLTNSNDPDKAARAVKMTTAGSVAHAYAKYLMESATSYAQAGTEESPSTTTTHEGEVWKSCASAGKDCATYGDFRAVGSKIASFTVNGKSLKPLIFVGNGRKTPLGSLGTVTLLTAYQSPVSGNLFVTLDLRASSQAIVVSDQTAYRNPNGVQINSVGVGGPETLQAHSRATYLAIFKRAKVGGTLTLGAFTTTGGAAGATATLPTR